MIDFLYRRKNLHHIGENLAQIGQLVQEIWQKLSCLCSGQIAVEVGRDGIARLAYKNEIVHHSGENMAQIGQLVQEI